MTDSAFLARVLSDGRWHSHGEILERSFTDRGHGLTVHSRAADLRKSGHVVETRLERDRRGRTLSFYRLVLDEAAASPGAVRDGSESSAVSSSALPNPATGDAPFSSVEPSTRASRDGGVLELFTCQIDESAGMRGAYWDAA